jgi:mRNA-degrading endonuclease toxin of MazEF toxin-antitoxin module
MIACDRGDVVLVGFVFTDESGRKVRPALVITSSAYHRARREVILAAITSNVCRRMFADHLLADWKAAGLLFPSLVAGIVRTVKQTTIERKLGSLTKADMQAVERGLRRVLDL